MPHFVVDKIQNALNDHAKPVAIPRAYLGVAYKRDIDDVRESPALDVMHLLRGEAPDFVFRSVCSLGTPGWNQPGIGR